MSRRRPSLAPWKRGIAAAFALLLGAVPVRAADPPAAVVVFDGSGSMWGRMEGERAAKFAIARDALKAPMSAMKPDVRLGLASYGHRRQADCNDVQVIVPPEAGNAERIGGALEKLNPRGKGPVANGLREASKALGKGPGRRSLILIHDDHDNCGIDTCTLLAELQANAPGLVVHAIGLGLKPDDAQKMQCLTEPTGGKVFDARNAAQVTSAVEEALRLASLDSGPPAPAAAAKTAPAPKATEAVRPTGGRAPLAKDGPPALRLATLLAGETEPRQRPVRWTISNDAGAVLATATGQDVVVPVATGRYTVEATDGLVSRRETVSAADKGHTQVDLALDAGVVRMPAATDSLPADALITLEDAAQSGRGRAVAVAAMRDIPPAWVVPPGKYVVGFEQGGARWQQAVDVAKGATVDLSHVKPFGRLQLAVNGFNPANAARLAVLVMVDDPDAPRGLREVARSAGATADFTLPAGTYAVIATQGALEARDRLSIAAGDVVQRAVSLTGAQLTLSSRLTGSANAPADEPVSYRISRVDVVPPEIITSVQRAPQLDLPAGRYRIEARHGLLNAKASREIELGPGQKANVVLEQQAGVVMMQPPSGHQGELFWQILDADRRVMWGTAQQTPRATLQAGRYIVRAETRAKSFERAIDLKPGQILPLQMSE